MTKQEHVGKADLLIGQEIFFLRTAR